MGRAAEGVASLKEGISLIEPLARDPKSFYDLSRYQAKLAGVALKPGSGLSADEIRREADRTVEMLKRAVKAGYRPDVENPDKQRIRDAIRSREDFQELLHGPGLPG